MLSEGLQYLVCVSVSLCVSVPMFSTTRRNEIAKKQWQQVQHYIGLILKLAIFVNRCIRTLRASGQCPPSAQRMLLTSELATNGVVVYHGRAPRSTMVICDLQ